MAKHDDGRLAPPIDSDEHKRILEHALARIQAGEQLHDKLVPGWVENYKAFRALPTLATPSGKQDWQSDVRSPYVAEQVLTMVPRMVEGRPAVDVQKQDPATPNEVMRAQRQYLTHNLYLDQFPMKASRLALHTILFGVGWAKQSFLRQQVSRDVFNRQTGKVERKIITVAARPTSSVPHPINTMWDPSAESLELARFVNCRTVTTTGQVKANERKKKRVKDEAVEGGYREEWCGRYSNTEHVKSIGTNEGQHEFPNELKIPDYVEAMCKGGGKVELIEVLDREQDTITVVANRQVVIRHHKLPQWHGQLPVAAMVTTPDVGRLNGIAEVDWIRGLQDMLWLLENQRLDNTRLQMDMVMLVRDTLMDTDEYVLEPGAKWPVTNMDDVQPLQYAQPQLASIGDMEMLRGRLQAIIGSAFMTGGGDSMGVSQDTASGLLSIIEEGNRRVDFRMNLATLAYDRMLYQNLSDAAQFLEDTQFVPGAQRGSDPIPVSPETLGAAAWVSVRLGSDTGVKSMRQQMATAMLTAAQMFKGQPIPTPEGMRVFNEAPLVEILADAWDREPDEFLMDPAAMQQVQQAQAPVAAVAEGQQGGMQVSTQGLPQDAPVGSIEGL